MKFTRLIVLLFFIIKTASPFLFVVANTDDIFTKHICAIEDENTKETEKEDKLDKEYFSSVDLFSIQIPVDSPVLSSRSINIFFNYNYCPSVPTPPPNLS